MASTEPNATPETKTKVISLNIGDLIAVILFAISLGTSIGFYIKNMSDIGDIKKAIEKTSDNISGISSKCASFQTSIDIIKDEIKEFKGDIKEIKFKK